MSGEVGQGVVMLEMLGEINQIENKVKKNKVKYSLFLHSNGSNENVDVKQLSLMSGHQMLERNKFASQTRNDLLPP